MLLARLVCLLALFCLASGQGSPSEPGSPDYDALQTELDRNHALWNSKSGCCYTMTISRQCFCLVESLGPFNAVVENDEIVSVEPEQFSEGLPTIEAVFEMIQDAINDKVARLTVSYDTSLGYPTNVFIDEDFQIADEEIGYEISVTLDSDPVEPKKCKLEIGRIDRRSSMRPKRNGFSVFEFRTNFNKWRLYSRSVGCSYTYKLTRSCFCSMDFVGPFIIAVDNNEIVSAVFEDASKGEIPESVLEDLPTITGLFQIIFDEAMSADKVNIVYDSTTGVPTSAAFDRIERAIDDEITYMAELL